MQLDKYYRSVNFNLVCFLYAKDQQIVGVNPISKNQKEFALIPSPELEEWVDLYKFGDRNDRRLFLEVHKYEWARRELLELLNAK